MFYWHKKYPFYNPPYGKEKSLENEARKRLSLTFATPGVNAKKQKLTPGERMTRTPEIYGPPLKDWPAELVERQLSCSLSSSIGRFVNRSFIVLYLSRWPGVID